MLFNSLHFLVFFPGVVVLYFALPQRFRWAWLLAASYYFYMCWRPAYILLIVASTLIDYVAGLQLGRCERPVLRRFWLGASLVVNLGLLFFFKYFNFFSGSVGGLWAVLGFEYEPPLLDVLLPVGISFYTFQTLSYTIDVYRREREPERNLGVFALYVAFFPQLVAGPIERSTRLLPQFFEKHEFSHERLRSGLSLMLWGFFKKVVIADTVAIYVNEVYGSPESYSGLPVLIATYFFAFQIFCDFSGYSDIAIGAAKVMGFELMENFRRPYHARSIGEFWKRWHISLSTWFRDYVYIPLGGNRVPVPRWYLNLIVVFAVSGLWHGADWTFLVWGLLHGFYLVAGIRTKAVRDRLAAFLLPGRLEVLRAPLSVLLTFHLVVLSWVFFRAPDVETALAMLIQMFSAFSLLDPAVLAPMDWPHMAVALGGIGLMECVHALQTRGSVRERIFALPLPLRWAVYYAGIFLTITFASVEVQEFIYFQF